MLVLAYPHEGEWFVPTMVRAHSMKEHAGQIALPGGRWMPAKHLQKRHSGSLKKSLGPAAAKIDVLGGSRRFSSSTATSMSDRSWAFARLVLISIRAPRRLLS